MTQVNTTRHIAGLLLTLWFGWVSGLSFLAVKFRHRAKDSRRKKAWLWVETALFLIGTLLMPVSVFFLISADIRSPWVLLAVIIFFAGMVISALSRTEIDTVPPSVPGG